MQILNKTYELSNNLNITPDVLRTYIKSFCYDVFTPFPKDT